jgi:hypothetical protein
MDASTAMLRAVFMAYLASLYVIDKQAVDDLRAFETSISSFRGSVRIRRRADRSQLDDASLLRCSETSGGTERVRILE